MPEKCVDNIRDCPVLPRLEALEKLQKEHSATHRGMFDRIRELEKSDAVQAETLKAINDKLDKLLAWQEEQRSRPGKRWESIVEKTVWAVCAAVIAFLLGRIGL